jgi:hypothetical protein
MLYWHWPLVYRAVMADDRATDAMIEAILRVNAACGQRTSHEKADLLLAAYTLCASNARNEALIEPDGFPRERDRQVALLRQAIELIAHDEPDLEAERLFQEGDLDGMRRHYEQLFGPDEVS